MNIKRGTFISAAIALTMGTVAGCGGADGGGGGSGGKDTPQPTASASSKETTAPAAKADISPFQLSIAMQQVADIPDKDNDVQKAIENYTNTKLDIQWIPSSNYTDKINVMIASGDMPMMVKVKDSPQIRSALQSGTFWEIGPYLKDYKNLSSVNPQYYDNISVDGKVYGIPNFRDIGRTGAIYRKDWLDALGLKYPVTLDDWYNVIKAMTLNDPDKNGKNDTYGTTLYKTYDLMFRRLATSQGAPNSWTEQNGTFTPDFMSPEYFDTMKLFRRLFAEKLINLDFPAMDESESNKLFDAGRVGFRITVATNAKGMQDRISKTDPKAQYDVSPMIGPKGIRLPGETGNVGFYIMSKASVKTEADLRKILAFADKMMDEPMNTLQLRGIEGKHYVKTADGKTEYKDFSLFQREIKPYRDNLFYMEGVNILPLKDVPIGEKATKVVKDNLQYAIPNPALTLSSATYADRGAELDLMIQDARTKYIMGQIDDAGWQAEIEKWRKSGGDNVIKEYEADFAKSKKK